VAPHAEQGARSLLFVEGCCQADVFVRQLTPFGTTPEHPEHQECARDT